MAIIYQTTAGPLDRWTGRCLLDKGRTKSLVAIRDVFIQSLLEIFREMNARTRPGILRQ